MSDLTQPDFYINRELSLLRFNRRVLEQATDENIPLLDRLRFLLICAANLDEFFEIRVADLKHKAAFGIGKASIDGLAPSDLLKKISGMTRELVAYQYQLLNKELIPALEKQKIRFIGQQQWNHAQAEWVKHYFMTEISPVVSPVGLDPAHPFPRLVNKSLNFIVSLKGKDAFGRTSHLAIVHAPRALPRAIRLPSSIVKDGDNFVFLSEIVQKHSNVLFPGMTVTGCYQFRLTRNSDLLLDEITDDLALALKSQLLSRRYGNAVRLEIADDCPKDIINFLLEKHNLNQDEVYLAQGPVNLSRFRKLIDAIQRPDLKFTSFDPVIPRRLQRNYNLFEVIRHGDILLHHPYQSFQPVLDFIRQAALDPNVLAIKQTLYRTGTNSQMVQALADAARAGKEVTAVIELRARFDEAYNLELANRLQEAGVLVVYGVLKFKTHAKMILVVRREEEKLRRYCHISTGNYHSKTAKQYTDYGLFTCDSVIGNDVHNLFQQLTGMSKTIKLKKLMHAPFTLYKGLIELIAHEIENAWQNKPARIILKLNAITEPQIIQALYEASRAGVQVDLIVRGVCCLRPGIPNVSENIRVYSIIGRFLEHERIYYFHNAGRYKLFCASADWMERNFFHRIEVCFPIQNKRLADRVKKYGLLIDLEDNCQRWELQTNGEYRKIHPEHEPLRAAQEFLLQKNLEALSQRSK